MCQTPVADQIAAILSQHGHIGIPARKNDSQLVVMVAPKTIALPLFRQVHEWHEQSARESMSSQNGFPMDQGLGD